jgi:hypothetical protein
MENNENSMVTVTNEAIEEIKDSVSTDKPATGTIGKIGVIAMGAIAGWELLVKPAVRFVRRKLVERKEKKSKNTSAENDNAGTEEGMDTSEI